MTTRFASVREARAAGAFERGWLPPTLPDSTRNITESNDLDANLGDGSFQFSPADYAAFASSLVPASSEVAQRNRFPPAAKRFAIFTYTADNTLWTLALHPRGEGFYTIRLLR